MSRNLELAQLAKSLTVDATGTITDLQIDTTAIEELPDINLSIAPEVLEIQVDAPDAGQATVWKWTWEQSTLPYARRTITNSNELNVPLYKEGTYVVNNFAAYDIHASMTQTHSLYLKWVDGAGTDNLISWATSAGPISDTHPDINGGAATDVQRITVNVPSTVTPPSLTNPSVAYTVVNNASGGYTFSGAAKGDNPNLGPFYRGGTYTINITATGHPFYFTTDNGTNFSAGTYFGEYTTGVTGSRNETGSITFTVPAGAPDTLYYQCGNHSAMRGEITVKDLAVETNINGNYVVYFQHTQEGHKTPVELRPIPSLVNQMCLVYDSTSGKFVPQDLATYVENTPSFENKIREVAGTAELVVEDGSAVIAKVNVYDDSTYLPLTGNNPGDQAFATDTDILYIWDGSAWQQAGAANSDDLTEGSTNLFFTNERVDDRVATLIVGGNNITATYDDAAGTLTLDGQPGYTDGDVGTYLTNNGYDTATNIVASITDSAPSTLDTLNELAAALGDDPNFATTTANNIATKLAITDFTSTADTWIGTKSTTNVAEGTNLYYTDARADARITASDTDALSDGTTNLYYTQGRFDSAFATKISSDVTFGGAVNATTLSGNGSGITNVPSGINRFNYTATAGQTTYSATYTTGAVDVFVNGIKLTRTTDFDDTSGTSIVLTTASVVGELVEINSYDTYTSADAVSASSGGTFAGPVILDNSAIVNTGTGGVDPTNTLQISRPASSDYSAISFRTAGVTDWSIGQNVTGGLEIYENGSDITTRLHISDGGNIGIGTKTPGYKLQVDHGTTAEYASSIRNTADNLQLLLGTTTGGLLNIQGKTISSNAAYQIALQAEGGKVGIGTASPGYKLSVDNGTSDGGIFKLNNEEIGLNVSVNGGVGDYTNSTRMVVFNATRYDTGTSPKLRLGGQGGLEFAADANNVRMVINTAGKVGIGTTSPQAKLHVYNENGGNATDKATMLSEAVLKLQPHTTNSTNLLVAQVNGGNGIGLQVTNGPATANWDIALSPFGGNVGIGTTNPGKLLTLSRATEAANEQLEFRVVGGITNNNYDGIKWSQGSSGGTTLATQRVHYYNTGEVDMGFSLRNDANILYLKRGGNVGIGTTNPDANLTVNNTDSSAYSPTSWPSNSTVTLKSPNNIDNYSSVRYTNSAGNYEWFTGAVQTSSNAADFVFQGYDRSGGAYKEMMRIRDSGAIDTPQQPACMIYCQAPDINWDVGYLIGYGTGNSIKAFDTTNSFNMSTHTYTAPEDGKYYVSFTANGVAGYGVPRAYPRVNGSNIGRDQHARGNSTITGDLDMRTYSGIIPMSANDTLNVYVGVGRWDTFGCNYFCVYKML